MGIKSSHRIQLVLNRSRILIIIFVSFICQNIWASQDAIVINDETIIYADEHMSAPIGYIRKGKKIKVGEIARNRAQVYPIIVSGKVAYIKVLDVSTEKESMDSERLTAERFQKTTQEKRKSSYSISYFSFSSEVKDDFMKLESTDKKYDWKGLSLKGSAEVLERVNIEFLANYMATDSVDGNTHFKAAELGFGGALKVIQTDRFGLNLEAQLLAVPWASYAFKEKFRVNGYGYSAGAGAQVTIRLGEHWGVEGFGGIYTTKLYSFDAPAPYQKVDPSFAGSRIGAGFNYQF